MKKLFIFKRILIIWSIVLIIMNLAIGQNSKINTFVKDIPAEIKKSAEKVLENGTVIFNKDNNITQKEILLSLDLDPDVTFKKERERRSRFNESVVFEKHQQYYKGIKVDGGGYTIKIDNSENGRIMLFTPNLYYHLSSLSLSLKEIDEYIHDLNLEGVIQPEISISDQYSQDYRLVLSYFTSREGKNIRIWIDANNGDVLHSVDYKMEIGGTTHTYGLQPMNDVTQSGTTTMRTPDGVLRVYEGGPYTEPLPNPIPANEWRQEDIPITTLNNWDTDASIISRQTFYTANLCIPQFLNAGIEFQNVHISTNNELGGFAYRNSSLANARINIGQRSNIPVSVFDIMAHEMSHCYLMAFLEYTNINRNMTLHEGIADVFGSYIESFIRIGGTDWITGGDESQLANIYNRNQTIQVCETTTPLIGHHQRGRIISHWYYAISTGIPSANIPSIGIQKAMDILTEALNNLSNPNAGLPQLRTETLLAAELNFGVCSNEYRAVLNAWDRVCVPGTEVILGISSINGEQPTCKLSNGSLSVNVCGESPFTFLWSNGETSQTIDGLSGGTYTVTVTNAEGNIVVGSTNLEEEIIAVSSNNFVLWSDIVNQYQLSQNELTDRSIYIEKDLYIDQDYLFSNVIFSFANGTGLFINEDVQVGILDKDGNQSLLHTCDTFWQGVVVKQNAVLTVKNTDILKVKTGISATNSSLLLYNINMDGFQGNKGIELFGDVNCDISSLNIHNFKTAVWSLANSKLPRFENSQIYFCENGFLMLATPAIISNIEIVVSENSIRLSGCPGSTISGCTINTGHTGIFAIGSNNIKILYNNQVNSSIHNMDIFANMINCQNSEVIGNNAHARQYGLINTESEYTHFAGNYFNILANPLFAGGGIQMNRCNHSTIEYNAIYTNQCKFGVETNNSFNISISDNYEINHTSNTPEFTAAIKTLGSNFQKIERNPVNTSGNVTGILAKNSPGNIYSCNYLTGPKEGLLIDYNSIFHDIKGNKFLNCATDLKIRSVVGPQYYKGNEFYNGNCLAEGLDEYQIENSRFLVNQNIPHHMPSNPNPDNGKWFRHQDVNEYFDDCPKDDPRGGRTGFDDEQVLNDYFDDLKLERNVSPQRFFVNMMHLLEYDYARDDYSLPRYITEDPVWLELDEWTELAEAINSLSDVAELSGQSALTQNDLDNLSTLQMAYVEADDEAAREVIYSQLSALMARLSPAFDQERTIDSLELDQLKIQFRSLSGRTDQMVIRWADIYSLYIDFLQKGVVAESNKAALHAYSRECADKYGDAIHLARSMANTFDKTYFDVFDDCPEEIRPRAASNTLNAIVQPNPTTGELNIVMENPFTGSIEMFDITGKLVYSGRCENILEKTIHLNLNEGVFMMKITSIDGESDIEKVIITK